MQECVRSRLSPLREASGGALQILEGSGRSPRGSAAIPSFRRTAEDVGVRVRIFPDALRIE